MKKSLSDKVIDTVTAVIEPLRIHKFLFGWFSLGSSIFYWVFLYVLFTCTLFLIAHVLRLGPIFFEIAWYSFWCSFMGWIGHTAIINNPGSPEYDEDDYAMFLWHYLCWLLCVIITVLRGIVKWLDVIMISG